MSKRQAYFASSAVPAGGELARLVERKDWGKTPLGAMQTWPQSLRSVVSILLSSRYAMWMGWGPELTFLYNDAYRPTLGLKHDRALGTPAATVWAEIWPDIGPRIESVLGTGKATYDEGLLLFLERSGFPEETYHTFSYSPITGDDRRVNGMLCVVTEETERVISERRMKTLRDLASGLSRASSENEVLGAIQAELKGNGEDLPFTLTYLFQESGEARLGCTTGIAQGDPAAAVSSQVSGFPWPAMDLFSGATSVLVDHLDRLWADRPVPSGAWKKPPYEAVAVPIKQTGQHPAGFLIVGINPYRRFDANYSGFLDLITGQMSASFANARIYEEERKRALALAELDKAKTAFFSNVSHEFRTPLTLMLGPVEDLLAKPDPELGASVRDSLELIHRSGLRLQRLVNTLLDFSRIEAGRTAANYLPTDLAALTTDLASTFRSAMDRGGLGYTIDCTLAGGVAYVDREMWEKIVLNLLSNAFKYTLEGTVSVRLVEEDNTARLTVADTGIGIPDSEIPRLFERFHRVEKSRGRTHEGSGIGLALVQDLVKLHGGRVTVSSSLGQGSTFTVELPLGSTHLPQDRIERERALPSTAVRPEAYVEEAIRWLPSAGGPDPLAVPGLVEAVTAELDSGLLVNDSQRTVLLVDDNADMRDYVARLLSQRYQVVTAANGEEAMTCLEKMPADLVLSDVMMPVVDGFELLKALRSREQTRTVPVILLSARAGEESRLEGLSAGADDYLVKPFTARELLARVETHLTLSQVRRESADEIRRQNAALMKANSELEEFAYVASHDFQEPLRMINVFTQLLLRKVPWKGDTDTERYAHSIQNGVRRIEELIQDLLDYSRVTHGEQEVDAVADLETSYSDAIAVLQSQIDATGTRIIKGELPVVQGGAKEFSLVFQNLIGNAVKYRAKTTEPLIEISAQQRPGEWIIQVKDNGIGFDPEHAEYILRLFRRLHKDAYPGTGLGLAICKRIVERYGGHLWATSDGPSQGATFSFSTKGVRRA